MTEMSQSLRISKDSSIFEKKLDDLQNDYKEDDVTKSSF